MPRGRPSTYDPKRHPRVVLSLARKGKTNEEISAALGIVGKTLHEWRHKYPEISSALKEGKEYADSQVETTLYQRAMGYSYQERKTINLPDGGVRIEITEKIVPPDTTAQIFWLKNRRPDEWRDKVQQELTGKDGGPVRLASVKDLTDDELIRIAAGSGE